MANQNEWRHEVQWAIPAVTLKPKEIVTYIISLFPEMSGQEFQNSIAEILSLLGEILSHWVSVYPEWTNNDVAGYCSLNDLFLLQVHLNFCFHFLGCVILRFIFSVKRVKILENVKPKRSKSLITKTQGIEIKMCLPACYLVLWNLLMKGNPQEGENFSPMWANSFLFQQKHYWTPLILIKNPTRVHVLHVKTKINMYSFTDCFTLDGMDGFEPVGEQMTHLAFKGSGQAASRHRLI